MKRFAKGGAVDNDKDDDNSAEETLLETGLSRPKLTADEKEERLLNGKLDMSEADRYAKGGTPEPSYEEKHALVMKGLQDKPLKMFDAGVVPDQLPPPDAPQESKLAAIMKAMGFGHTPDGSANVDAAGSIPGAVGSLLNKAVPMAAPNLAANTANMANVDPRSVVPAVNAGLGTNFQAPTDTPATMDPHIANFVNQARGVNAVTAPQAPAAPTVPKQPMATPEPKAPSFDFNSLYNQDPTKIAPGFNPADRQKLAGDVWNQTHTVGSMIAEALAGLGDAVAAKGGVNQDMLSKVIATQTANRAEHLANFDKARQGAVENFTMKTQMGENAVKMLAAKDAYGPASPAMVKLLGGMGIQIPNGTLNKDLPQFFEAAKLKASQSVAQGDMLMKAVKQASDETDAAEKGGSLLHMHASPQQREAMIKDRTNDLMAQMQSMVHVRTSAGKELYLPSKSLDAAKKRDPGIKVMQ